jgi:hypothetical protein
VNQKGINHSVVCVLSRSSANHSIPWSPDTTKDTEIPLLDALLERNVVLITVGMSGPCLFQAYVLFSSRWSLRLGMNSYKKNLPS